MYSTFCTEVKKTNCNKGISTMSWEYKEYQRAHLFFHKAALETDESMLQEGKALTQLEKSDMSKGLLNQVRYILNMPAVKANKLIELSISFF